MPVGQNAKYRIGQQDVLCEENTTHNHTKQSDRNDILDNGHSFKTSNSQITY